MPQYLSQALLGQDHAAVDGGSVCCTETAFHSLRPRHHRDFSSFTAAPPPAAAPPAGAPPATSAGGEANDADPGEGTKIEYNIPGLNKKIMLDGTDLSKCKSDCNNAPEIKGQEDIVEGGTTTDKGFLTGTSADLAGDCEAFCTAEVASSQCFPGTSTVVVRNAGRLPLEKLSVGDEVLVLRSKQSGATRFDASSVELTYEPVIAWLHHEPDRKLDVLTISHELGSLSLTPDHLVFSKQAGDAVPYSIAARDVVIGDRVLAPWMDGSLSEPKVLDVCPSVGVGAYCPLVPSGRLIVDNTLASCYMVPQDIVDSPAYPKVVAAVKSIFGKEDAHEICHALMEPLRTSWTSQTLAASLKSSLSVRGTADSHAAVAEKRSEQIIGNAKIHPYGTFLYVLAKSVGF